MALLHLQSQAGKGEINRRVDLRLVNKRGVPIYDKTFRPIPGTLVKVEIVQRARGRRIKVKYLEWYYKPDAGVKVPSPTPGYARVRLGLTSGNYYMAALE